MLLQNISKQIGILSILIFSITTLLQAQDFTYVDTDPTLEKEAKDKEAYFNDLRKKASANYAACVQPASCVPIGHTHDPNDRDGPCLPAPSKACECHCRCERDYADALKRIEHEENRWRTDYSVRYEAWKQKAAKQQTVNNNLNQHKQQTTFNQSYEQTSKELDNAKDISMQAYQSAISEGNTQSYSFAKGILEGASQISDPKTALVYTGVGLGLSLLFNSGERKREAHERELQEYDKRIQKAREGKMKLQQEAALKQVKEQFITDAKNINKYGVSDIVNNKRYMTILLVPYVYTAENQDIYFSTPQYVPALSDGTYPLKTDVQAQAAKQVKALNLEGMQLILLYPIVNPNEFINEFTKKMGSGAVINFNAHLLRLITTAIEEEPAQQQNPSNKKDNFWNN